MQARVRPPLQEARALAAVPGSCITVLQKTLTLMVHPMYSHKIKRGIDAELSAQIARYSKVLGGILMGYDGIKLVSAHGWLFDTNPYNHVTIRANFYVFAPQVGSVLEGTVKKRSNNHLGCLVHGAFNVCVRRPLETSPDDWCGSLLQEGDVVGLTVRLTNMTNFMPYIEADLDPDRVQEVVNARSEEGQDSDFGPAVNKRILFEDDSGVYSSGAEDPAGGTEADQQAVEKVSSGNIDKGSSKKKKKKKKKLEDGQIDESMETKKVEESERSTLKSDSDVSPKKAKKTKKIKKEKNPSDSQADQTDDQNNGNIEGKVKKYKKEFNEMKKVDEDVLVGENTKKRKRKDDSPVEKKTKKRKLVKSDESQTNVMYVKRENLEHSPEVTKKDKKKKRKEQSDEVGNISTVNIKTEILSPDRLAPDASSSSVTPVVVSARKKKKTKLSPDVSINNLLAQLPFADAGFDNLPEKTEVKSHEQKTKVKKRKHKGLV